MLRLCLVLMFACALSATSFADSTLDAARDAAVQAEKMAPPDAPPIAPPAYPPPSDCMRLEALLKIIVGQRRLGYLADAVDQTGIVRMWFISNQRREWVEITVNHDLTACIIAQGQDWHFAMEPVQNP